MLRQCLLAYMIVAYRLVLQILAKMGRRLHHGATTTDMYPYVATFTKVPLNNFILFQSKAAKTADA